LRSYQPPAEVAALADKTSMSDYARRVYYLAKPAVDQKADFNQNCPVNEKTLVLGCYNKSRIHVLQVDRPELAKVMDVSAAHEMLHAAYGRLSNKDREQVNQWIEDYYRKSSDPKLSQLVAEYDQSEPGQRLNELHSILGTQVSLLSPELENYYKKYFSNRSQVVADYLAYEGVFSNIESQITALHSQIDSLKTQIDSMESQLKTQQAQLDSIDHQLDSYRSSGNISAYNALVPTQNAQVNAYNSLLSRYKSAISSYNAKVDQVNQLAVQQNQLVDSLSSTKFTLAQ
jgi:chromosome segregation ATPase